MAHLPVEGNDSSENDGRDHRDDRRPEEENAVCLGRRQLFL